MSKNVIAYLLKFMPGEAYIDGPINGHLYMNAAKLSLPCPSRRTGQAARGVHGSRSVSLQVYLPTHLLHVHDPRGRHR